jgi:hypothetical protein
MTETELKTIQKIFQIEVTGKLDALTQSAIKNYQLRLGSLPTGLLDSQTYHSILAKYGTPEIINSQEPEIVIETPIEIEEEFDPTFDKTTDLSEEYKMEINEYFIKNTEYSNEKKLPKEYIFLHHTAGWNDPYAVADNWERDKLGKIATHFIIGGINIKTGDSKHNGVVVQCIPDNAWAYHLGSVNAYMHQHSIGIEICNFGALTKKSGKYYTYTNQVVDEKYVVDLGDDFRGYRYWHRYTDKQVESTRLLINYIADKFNINIDLGLKAKLQSGDDFNAFEYDKKAVEGRIKGILSHTSVRTDKLDVSPQAHLVEMIKNL